MTEGECPLSSDKEGNVAVLSRKLGLNCTQSGEHAKKNESDCTYIDLLLYVNAGTERAPVPVPTLM